MNKTLVGLGIGATMLAGGTLPIVPVQYVFVESDQVPYYDTVDGKLHAGDCVVLENGIMAISTTTFPYLEKIDSIKNCPLRTLQRYEYPTWYKNVATGDIATSTMTALEYNGLQAQGAVNPTLTIYQTVLQTI
jgi:hypothetical protein